MRRPDGRQIEFKTGQRGRGQRGQQGSPVYHPTRQKKNKALSLGCLLTRSPRPLRISAGLAPPLCSHWLPSWSWADLNQSHPPIWTIFRNKDMELGLAVFFSFFSFSVGAHGNKVEASRLSRLFLNCILKPPGPGPRL